VEGTSASPGSTANLKNSYNDAMLVPSFHS
jgi:hypothetical protein